jgi:hypothetical protein
LSASLNVVNSALSASEKRTEPLRVRMVSGPRKERGMCNVMGPLEECAWKWIGVRKGAGPACW